MIGDLVSLLNAHPNMGPQVAAQDASFRTPESSIEDLIMRELQASISPGQLGQYSAPGMQPLAGARSDSFAALTQRAPASLTLPPELIQLLLGLLAPQMISNLGSMGAAPPASQALSTVPMGAPGQGVMQ